MLGFHQSGAFDGFTPEFAVVTLDSKYKEIAGFGSVTWHASPRFDVTAGARYSHNKQKSEQFTNILGGAPLLGDLTTINGKSDESVFTWSIAPRYEVNDLRVGLWPDRQGLSSGRSECHSAGRAGPKCRALTTPTRSSAMKRAFAAKPRTACSASTRRSITSTGTTFSSSRRSTRTVGPFGVNANGRGARSYGAELALTARPTRGLNLQANLAYTNAKLTDDTVLEEGGPNVPGGLDGDRLPFTPEWSANLSADYEWAAWDGARAYVGGNFRWVSDQFTGGFSPTYRADFGERLEIDSYATVDLRAGVDMGRFNVAALRQEPLRHRRLRQSGLSAGRSSVARANQHGGSSGLRDAVPPENHWPDRRLRVLIQWEALPIQ